MSALPQTFPMSPLVPGERYAPGKKKRAALKVVPRRAPQPGTQATCMPADHPGADFAAVYHTYKRRVFSQCLSMLRNHAEAEDAAQEVFLQLYRKVHTFRGESRFSTWLHRLTTNCVLMDMRRKRNRWRETAVPDATGPSSDWNSGPEASLDSFQAPVVPLFDQVSLRTAMAQLPSGFQRIFHLHDVEGYTHEEIASLLSIQAGTSKSQLHKARLRLRRLLHSGKNSPTRSLRPEHRGAA